MSLEEDGFLTEGPDEPKAKAARQEEDSDSDYDEDSWGGSKAYDEELRKAIKRSRADVEAATTSVGPTAIATRSEQGEMTEPSASAAGPAPPPQPPVRPTFEFNSIEDMREQLRMDGNQLSPRMCNCGVDQVRGSMRYKLTTHEGQIRWADNFEWDVPE